MNALKKAIAAAKRELGIREMVMTSPDHLNELQAQRIVRAVLMAVRDLDFKAVRAMQTAPLSAKAKAAGNTFDRMNASTEAMWQAGIDAILASPSEAPAGSVDPM